MNIEDFNYEKFTPMMKQYIEIKNRNQESIVFFRLGDFYEMFFSDAITASRELEIALTGRDAGQESRIPMCGIPSHAHLTYAEKLLEKGYKVAIVEQIEDAVKGSTTIVKRDVVKIYTPGTLTNLGLDSRRNNYIASLRNVRKSFYLSVSDISTGELLVYSFDDFQESLNEIVSLNVREIILDSSLNKKYKDLLSNNYQIMITLEENIDSPIPIGSTKLLMGLTDNEEINTINLLINYLIKTQKSELTHLKPVVKLESKQFMKIDMHSKRNLELTETMRMNQKQGSLLHLLDKCETAMGSRMLAKWINHPLVNLNDINYRLNIVDTFASNFISSKETTGYLRNVYDLERILGRLVVNAANAKDLIQLRKTLHSIPLVKEGLASYNSSIIDDLNSKISPCKDLLDQLDLFLVENPPLSIKEGGMINRGVNEELDKLFDLKENSSNWLISFEESEREKTGIKNLKVGYNRIFGYYLEVTKSQIGMMPEEGYERKQTLANCERYVTEELKHYEGLILNASDKIVQLEYELFLSLREFCIKFVKDLQELADNISTVDCLLNFANISNKNNYVKPDFNLENKLEVINGRHPVIETLLLNKYISNDCYIGEYNNILITGPNMSGKSTYMRMIALVSVMAQIGCFVPASRANLPIYDQIFTRIGASDDLMSGQSTFMVEMQEANYAISHATKKSLILFDEIGRGTATFDGLALAQAIVEFVHDKIGCAMLFSTHYHELVQLENNLKRLKNVHVSAKEEGSGVVFLHKVVDGAVDKSYGINVAALAKLPKSLIERSKILLKDLEKNSEKYKLQDNLFSFDTIEEVEEVVENNEVYNELKNTNLDNLTPIQCMNFLYELKSKIK